MAKYVGKKETTKRINSLLSDFNEAIKALSIQQLRAMIKQAKGYNETNCWWLAYGAKDFIISVAENEMQWKIKQRRISRQKNKKAI